MKDKTSRKNKFLKLIIEDYIKEGRPISSGNLRIKHGLDYSSSTLRIIMSNLEEEGLLEKNHTSGGRLPTIKGLQYYSKYLSTIDQAQEEKMYSKLKSLFARRYISIEDTINEATKIIGDFTKLTSIRSNSLDEERLKLIQLVDVNETDGILLIVTSLKNVKHIPIQLDSKLMNINDLKIAIKLFSSRLENSKLSEIPNRLESLKGLLEKEVKNAEIIIKTITYQIAKMNETLNKNVVYNKDHLIMSNNFSREKIAKLLHQIETTSIWQTIENHSEDDETLKIDIRPDKTTWVSKKITYNKGKITEISFIGNDRMDYARLLSAISSLEKILKEKTNK